MVWVSTSLNVCFSSSRYFGRYADSVRPPEYRAGDPSKLTGGDKALSPRWSFSFASAITWSRRTRTATRFLTRTATPFKASLVDRYLYYMNGLLLMAYLGNSYQRKLPVTEIFAQKYPYTVKLAACAIVLEAIMGIGAGIISAVKRYSLLGYFGNAHHVDHRCRPGLLARYVCSCSLASSSRMPPAAHSPCRFRVPAVPALSIRLGCTMLPTITLASVSTAYAARIMRSQLLDVMNQDYIRTAKAKGLSIARSSSSMRLRMHSSPSLPILVSTLAACFRAPS